MQRHRRASSKVRKYAYGLMNTDLTKQQIALDAGYSQSMSRVPQVIEHTNGYKLAMVEIANECNNLAMGVLFALNARDMQTEDTKTLLSALDIISKVAERYMPKEKTINNNLIGIFDNVSDVLPAIVDLTKQQSDGITTTPSNEIVKNGIDKDNNALHNENTQYNTDK